jgi:translation initiation factor 1 (eIF-1/SUI1)
MARTEKKPRVKLNPDQDGLTGLGALLGGVDTSGMDPGPSTPSEGLRQKSELPTGRRLVIRKETAHRSGKAVVVIHGFDDAWSTEQVAELARTLFKGLACGGTHSEDQIEVQTSQPDRVRMFLQAKGFRVAGL